MIVVGFSRELGPAANPFTEETMLKMCIICSKEFDAYRSGKLCSDACRREKERQRNSIRTATKEYQEKQKKYRKKTRSEHAKKQREYHNLNRELINLRSRQRYAENPEPAKLQAKEWSRKNKKRVSINNKAWVKANHDRVRASQHKHRSAKKFNGGSYSVSEWESLCKKYNYRCLGCGKKRKLTADHVIPISKGGTSNIDNIQPLCGPCNSSKGTKTTDFRRPHGKR
jgi:5-methylcytosine-specific restriction endonuclease McrA